jgi:hypothetical protein
MLTFGMTMIRFQGKVLGEHCEYVSSPTIHTFLYDDDDDVAILLHR